MTDVALPGLIEPARRKGPDLDRGQHPLTAIILLGILASGLLFGFPLGVLLYWFTSNLWTLAQQAYIIRFHPPRSHG